MKLNIIFRISIGIFSLSQMNSIKNSLDFSLSNNILSAQWHIVKELYDESDG